MATVSAVTIAARLDRLPPSNYVRKLIVLISLGGWFEFYDLFFTAAVLSSAVSSGTSAQGLGLMVAYCLGLGLPRTGAWPGTPGGARTRPSGGTSSPARPAARSGWSHAEYGN